VIEEGKTYKLKKIKDFFGTNTDDDFKVLKIVGDTVYSQNQETKEPLMCNIKDFIDPEYPDDIYSDFQIVMEKLESVMKPMDLHFWKDLQEEATFSALGAAPCPAMGQVMGTTVNGIPVEGKSVKKKKKKKHEAITWVDREGVEHTEIEPRPSSTLDDIDREEYANNLEKTGWMDTPKQMFKQNKGQTDDPEFEDAINILLFGGIEDKKEYEELIELFCECGRFGDFARLANEKYGLDLKDLDSSNIGKDIDENFEIKWLDEDFHEAYERITNLLAKQLDRMNFEYANTEEIIYKKEGAYRYLLKFDNEIGILKFKVTKDDATIIEKEWQLDEKEDVSPIFAEIEGIYNKYGI